MSDIMTSPWFFAVVGGFILLGLFIAYGMMRNRQRTPLDKAVTEQGTRDIYNKDVREPRVPPPEGRL